MMLTDLPELGVPVKPSPEECTVLPNTPSPYARLCPLQVEPGTAKESRQPGVRLPSLLTAVGGKLTQIAGWTGVQLQQTLQMGTRTATFWRRRATSRECRGVEETRMGRVDGDDWRGRASRYGSQCVPFLFNTLLRSILTSWTVEVMPFFADIFMNGPELLPKDEQPPDS